MNKRIFSTLFTCVSLILPLSAEASNLTKIIFFGDSLVDTGNVFNSTEFPDSPPYFEGRFSNDKIWVDTLTESLDLNPVLSSELGTTIPTDGVNFAIGGATTGSDNITGDNSSGLQQQIEAFTDLTAFFPADADALNVIWAGSNDYFLGLSNPETLIEVPEQATDNLSGAVESLYEVGARNFLVVNVPDLGETPSLNELEVLLPGVSNQIDNLIGVHNSLLEQKLGNLNTSLPGIEITTLDANSLLQDILAEPNQFGFTETENSCLLNSQLIPSVSFDGICDNPDEFVFWDEIHPTSATHQVVAEVAINTLQDKGYVSEPDNVEHLPEPNNVPSLLLFATSILSWLGYSKCKFNLMK